MPDDSLAEQLDQVVRLAELERELAALRASEAQAEVRQLESAGERPPLDLTSSGAVELGRLLVERRRLERQLAALASPVGASRETGDQREARREAREALERWLRADEESPTTFRMVRMVVLVLTVAILWAAFAVHPAMLILLVPIFVPLSLLLRRGENKTWRRVGAKQAFERTGITPPDVWSEASVQARLDMLEDELASAASDQERLASSETSDDERERDKHYAAYALEFASVEQAVGVAASANGVSLDSFDAEDITQLIDYYEGHGEAVDLGAITAKRQSVQRDADAIRDEVFRFLSRADRVPDGGRADAATLRAQLEALNAC
ncbi:MAG: hypothetical protein AAF493_22610 [Pseudomonadota bacterium]